MATVSRVAAEAQHLADAPPQQLGQGSYLPSASFFGPKSCSESESSGRYMCGGLQFHEPSADSSVSSLAPTPPAPARERVRDHIKFREPRVNPKVRLAQSKRFAEGALENYNKMKKVKFELVDVVPCISIPEPRCCYTHINFTARSSKEGSQEQLFFAELYHWHRRLTVRRKEGLQEEPSIAGSGKRLVSRGFSVTCCEPLGRDSTVGRKLFKRDGSSVVRKNADFTYCYGCTEVISHPKGEKFVAGHCNIPYIYEFLR